MHVEEIRRYHVGEVLGRGGFGTVYRADLLGVDGFARPVAIKILNPDLDETGEIALRLRDEARMLGLVRHRAIVQVDALVRLAGRWAVVMEYVDGVDLRTVLQRGPVPPGVALEIIQEVATALHVAHDCPGPGGQPLRILHRDLKPANLQLTPAGEVKVLDFGVARAEFDAREASTQRTFFGSMPYMSPERIEFVDTHAGDIYALGAVLFELLTGTLFGETSSDEEEHDEKLTRALRRLQRMVPDRRVRDLVRDTLLFDPDRRPDARELERRARELRQQLDEPWLSDWAEGVVPYLVQARSQDQDELSGRSLKEDEPRPLRAPVRRSSSVPPEEGWPPWLMIWLAGASGALAVVVLALLVAALFGMGPPRSQAWVHIEGDAEEVALVSEGGRFQAGRVPAGRYLIRAAFPGEPPREVGSLILQGGDQITLACEASLGTCSRRREP